MTPLRLSHFALLCAAIAAPIALAGCPPAAPSQNGLVAPDNSTDNTAGNDLADTGTTPESPWGRILANWQRVRLDSVNRNTGEPAGWQVYELGATQAEGQHIRYTFRSDSTEPGSQAMTWAETGELNTAPVADSGLPVLIGCQTVYESGGRTFRQTLTIANNTVTTVLTPPLGDPERTFPAGRAPISIGSLLLAVAMLDIEKRSEWPIDILPASLDGEATQPHTIRLEARDDAAIDGQPCLRFVVESARKELLWRVWVDPETRTPLRTESGPVCFAALKLPPDRMPGGPGAVFSACRRPRLPATVPGCWHAGRPRRG